MLNLLCLASNSCSGGGRCERWCGPWAFAFVAFEVQCSDSSSSAHCLLSLSAPPLRCDYFPMGLRAY